MSTDEFDPWYLENLVCPVTRRSLKRVGNYLVSEGGSRYPIADGIPVMLVPDRPHTIGLASESIRIGNAIASGSPDPFAVDSLGINQLERGRLRTKIDTRSESGPDPVACFLVGATNGIAYENLIENLSEYPIPESPLLPGDGRLLLDIGCNWGRWCVASARIGYQPVGIDPSLGAIFAARRISKSLNTKCRFVVADARWLPFREGVFDTAYSFSVIQHFAKSDASKAIMEIGRVLRDGGEAFVQMPTVFGIRCLWHQARRGFRDPQDFDVRYYTVPELQRMFDKAIGDSRTTVHCYLGIGLLKSDFRFMSVTGKIAIVLSECGRIASRFVPPLKYVADSVYVTATKRPPN